MAVPFLPDSANLIAPRRAVGIDVPGLATTHPDRRRVMTASISSEERSQFSSSIGGYFLKRQRTREKELPVPHEFLRNGWLCPNSALVPIGKPSVGTFFADWLAHVRANAAWIGFLGHGLSKARREGTSSDPPVNRFYVVAVRSMLDLSRPLRLRPADDDVLTFKTNTTPICSKPPRRTETFIRSSIVLSLCITVSLRFSASD